MIQKAASSVAVAVSIWEDTFRFHGIGYGAGRAFNQGKSRKLHQDLGTLDDPVILFGGPYSNLQATQALLEVADKWGVSFNQVVCTGDVVAYCAHPEATAELVRKSGLVVVAGNCERQLGHGADTCGCGFAQGTTCDVLSAEWYAYAGAHISAETRAWMRDLPDVVSFRHQGARYAVLHGGMTDIARFIWPSDPDEVFEQEFDAVQDRIGEVDHIIAGHCGLPYIRQTARGRWINAGVIGMPPNDGRQHTRFAVLDGGDVLFHHLAYDAGSAAKAMQTFGLTQGYDSALLGGYWPSEEVLPLSLRSSSLANG